MLKKHFKKEFKGIVIVDDVGYIFPFYIALKNHTNICLVCWIHMHFYNGRFGVFAWFGKRIVARKFNKLVVLTREDCENYRQICDCKNIWQIYNLINSGINRSEYDVNSKKNYKLRKA